MSEEEELMSQKSEQIVKEPSFYTKHKKIIGYAISAILACLLVELMPDNAFKFFVALCITRLVLFKSLI